MATDAAVRYHDAVLVIELRDGTQIIKTNEEMEKETPDFKGITTHAHFVQDAYGNPIPEQRYIDKWIVQRGFVAEASAMKLRAFDTNQAEAMRKLKVKVDAQSK